MFVCFLKSSYDKDKSHTKIAKFSKFVHCFTQLLHIKLPHISCGDILCGTCLEMNGESTAIGRKYSIRMHVSEKKKFFLSKTKNIEQENTPSHISSDV